MDAHIYSIIDKEKMKDMLHSFQACTGLLIQVIDENGAVVLSEGTGEPFCSQFQKHLAENDSCQKTHTNASKKAVELGEAYIFSCHAGLNHIVFPLISRKAFFGSVLVGPFLMDTPDSSLIMEIAKNNSSQIELLPFTCVVDPRRYSTIYIHPEKNTFNDEATYMYKKQLEYGDILLLNKCDLISEAEKNAVLSSMKKNFPHAQIVPISAIDSENFESWTDEFTKGQKPSFRKLDIDWDYINHGDEHMGWFNNILKFSSSAPIDFNDVTVYLINEIQQGFLEKDAEIAHLKVMCYSESEFSKAAVTSTVQAAYLSNSMTEKESEVLCNINIRAILNPESISSIINAAVKAAVSKYGLSSHDKKEQAFSSFEPAPKAE